MIDSTDYSAQPAEAALWAEGYKAAAQGLSAQLSAAFSTPEAGQVWLAGHDAGVGKKPTSYRPRKNPHLHRRSLLSRLLSR